MADGSSSSPESTPIRREIMLFGVRVVVDSLRKSVSLNNLSDYNQTLEAPKIDEDGVRKGKNNTSSGYTSADEAIPISTSAKNRERKRGVPWSEEEHKLFLIGLKKVGKGDWKRISKNFVKSRTSTQVASHAQKYFLRRNNLNRRGRRSSLFDMTTETVIPMEQDQVLMQENTSQSPSLIPEINNFSIYPIMQIVPEFSLNLLLASSNLNEPSSSSSKHSTFNAIGVA